MCHQIFADYQMGFCCCNEASRSSTSMRETWWALVRIKQRTVDSVDYKYLMHQDLDLQYVTSPLSTHIVAAFQKTWRPEPWSLFSKEWWFCNASLADFRTQHIHQRCIEEAGCASTETSWSFRERGVKMVPKRHWNHISSYWTSLGATLRHRESTFFTVCWSLTC